MMRLASLLPAVAVLVACGGANSSTTGANAAPTAEQQLAYTRANQLRNDALEPALTLSQVLDVAATRHAGYQAIRNQIDGTVLLTHYETAPPPTGVDPPSPTGVADTGNALYSGVTLTARFTAANGGSPPFGGSHVYAEGITSQPGGGASVLSLWNTVYHRLPLCRRESQLFGYGESDTARLQYPSANVPAVSGFATADVAGPYPPTVTSSFWPKDGLTNLAPVFSSDLETPDPISASNTGQSPGTPNQGDVGLPIHIIYPTSKTWTSITVSLARQSAPTTQLSVYVLAGYHHVDPSKFSDPVANPPPATTITVNATVTAWTWDVELDEGEVFIVPVNPLLGGSVGYQYSVDALTVGPSPDNFKVGTTTPIRFSTQ